jgi:hypothetical protein
MSGVTTLSMSQFLEEIQFAVESALPTVWRDHDEAHALLTQVRALEAQVAAGYQRAASFYDNAEDPEDVAMSAGIQRETYFGVDKDRHEEQERLDVLRARFDARRFSLAATAGTILQFAKQGISMVHGGPGTCPPGRTIGTAESLKNVIWQGRNQAIHWEEGKLTDAVTTCFGHLTSDFGKPFDDVFAGSLAFRVVHLLGWRTWGEFATDMSSLG